MTKRRAVKRWMMPSTSDPIRTTYTVTRWSDGDLSCNCPGWVFKMAGQDRTCLHVSGVQVSEAVAAGKSSVAVTVRVPLPAAETTTGRRRIILED